MCMKRPPAWLGLHRFVPETASGRISAVRFPVIIVVVAMAAVTVWQIHQQTQTLDASQQSSATVSAAQQASVDWLLADTLAGRYILTPIPETAAAVHGLEQQSLQNIDTAIGLSEAADSIDQAQTLGAIRLQAEIAITSRQQAMDAAAAGDPATAGGLLIQGLSDSQWVSASFTDILSTESKRPIPSAISPRPRRPSPHG